MGFFSVLCFGGDPGQWRDSPKVTQVVCAGISNRFSWPWGSDSLLWSLSWWVKHMAQCEERKYLALWIKNKHMYLPLKNVQDSFLFYFFSAFSFFHVSQTLSRNILNFYKLIKPQNSFYLNQHTLAWSMHFSAISVPFQSFVLHPAQLRWFKKNTQKNTSPLRKGHMKM